MSKKLDHHLIKKYYRPAETKPKKSKNEFGSLIAVALLFQDGWLWVRDRGILLETKQDLQFRLSLNINRQGLDNLLVSLQPSLSDMNYNIGNLRKFQP